MNDISEISFLARGFRPFFFFGALLSVLSVFIWGGFYAGYWNAPSFAGDNILWHAHEMVFGYTVAIIAGFLLTAVANWTGGAPVRQFHLLGLVILWLVGRIVMSVDMGLPFWAVCVLELAFLPALAGSLSIPLLKSWNKRNFIFLVLLTVLWGFDMWFLLLEATTPLYLALFVTMIMMSLIGGRIIPAFTVGGLRQSGEEVFQTGQPKMDILALISLILVMISFALDISIALAITAIFSAGVHLFRMRYYNTMRVWKHPMLWILHIGYLWLVIGLFLLGLSGLDLIPQSSALHALTTGAIGSMTLGMMCRVAMGHTGRVIQANKITLFAFIIMQIVVFIRVFMPLILPEHMMFLMTLSAGLWSVCFLIYLAVYSPMLWGARPDGKQA